MTVSEKIKKKTDPDQPLSVLDAAERDTRLRVCRALRLNGGCVVAAAKDLRMSRRWVYKWLKRWDIKAADYR